MKEIRRINVNNQNVLVLAKDGSTYYKWLENKKGERDLDPFWNIEITEDLYNQVLNDYKGGVIQGAYGKFPIVENPLEKLSDEHVLNITNWFAYAYSTWDKNIGGWSYGRNTNYKEELEAFKLKNNLK